MNGTVTINGETFDLTHTGPSFKFASLYRTVDGETMIKVHRSENVARKGQWDSPAMRKVWIYSGYGEIVR